MKTTRWFLILLVLAAASVYSPPAMAEQGHDLEQMITNATAPADHEAVAALYERRQARAAAKAKEHQKMAESYRKAGGAAVQKHHLDQHCDNLAKSYEKTAAEYAALAKAHHEMAKPVK